jgi:hypothetical protein
MQRLPVVLTLMNLALLIVLPKIASKSGERYAAAGQTRTAQVTCAVPSFSKPVNFETGLFASGVALADFNLDGALDMAVSNQNAGNVSILIGDGTGNFGAKTDFPVGGPPQRIIAADLNRDGKLDLILPIQALNAVAILLGDGHGSFGKPMMVPVDGGPFMPVVADFNADGKPDLGVTITTAGARKVAVLLGDGLGGFDAPRYFGAFANSPLALGAEDFNGDGKLDLAVGGGANSPDDTNNLSILFGDGEGGFGAPTYFTIGQAPQSMSIADFNGDGLADIAVSNSIASGANSTVSVLLGRGNGIFAGRTAFPIGESGRGTGVADFNLDGKLDLVVANSNSNTVSVLLGDGKGGFGPKTDFAVGKNPRKLAVGDVNHDGRPDIITPNTGSNDVSVLLNTCMP